eukprot:CAMPEP_0206163696 /NCGR_PEP_ID=MMETSP1474-20131121/11569_1 /ASSEMBLY_ACC=CAM_ASM_001110 /TAXON_ID=97495 /ORGANISM="Imantonia sp., Strain RCC918" /LENGTH=131 /DNA_ID=CAMNT_0053566255 /DNA_START=487 /DNA_END=884 /DNA_ORIENTATION=+
MENQALSAAPGGPRQATALKSDAFLLRLRLLSGGSLALRRGDGQDAAEEGTRHPPDLPEEALALDATAFSSSSSTHTFTNASISASSSAFLAAASSAFVFFFSTWATAAFEAPRQPTSPPRSSAAAAQESQ